MNSQCMDVLMSSLKSMRAARRVLVAGPVVVEGHGMHYRYSSGRPLVEVGGDVEDVAETVPGARAGTPGSPAGRSADHPTHPIQSSLTPSRLNAVTQG